MGGTDVASDVRKFETSGGHILVGTPGRIDDLLSGKGANGSIAVQGGSKIKAGLKACVSRTDVFKEIQFCTSGNEAGVS